jgi:hypothetical protein
VSSTAPEPTNVTPIPFTVTFDKAVQNFVASDVTVVNGTVSKFTPAADNKSFTFNALPSGQGAVTVSVAAGVATDAAGNPNVASNTLTRTLDTIAPTVTANPLTTSNNTPTLTGTVNDPTAAVSVTVGGTTRSAVVSGNTWSLALTSPLADGQYTVDVTATDPAGNTGTSTLANGLVIDTTPPTVSLSTTSPNPTNAASFSVKVQFSEVVSGFDVSKIQVNNGIASNLVTQDKRTFTVDVAPKGDGTVTVTVPANVAQDEVNLGNTAAAAPVTVTSDRTAPSATISPTSTGPITGTASDATAGVQKVEVTISNGTMFWSGSAFDSTTPVLLAATSSDGFATWSVAFTGPPATYQVTAKVTDNAGNVGGNFGGTPVDVVVT